MSAIHDSIFVGDYDCEIQFFQVADRKLILQISEGCETAKVSLSFEQVELIRNRLNEWLEDELCGS